ncbi:MAG: FkbM family methyltransferase [Acidimicrobiales bacterium]
MPASRFGRSSTAQLLTRLRGHGALTGQAALGPDVAATEADVAACYRLLLGRPADPEGLAHYRQRLASGATLAQVVNEFLGSVEFSRRHPDLYRAGSTAQLVSTSESFHIYVDPTDYAVGHTIARSGLYEPDVTAVLRRDLGPGSTFVDIGANVGWFSLLGASLVGPGGRVVAVEPNPSNVALLTKSAEENGFANLDVLNMALSDRSSAVALETDGSNGRIVPIEGPPRSPVRASWVVAAQPLDEALATMALSRVDMVKLDVEGAEPLVLRGAASTLARYRPVIITEFFPRALDASPWGDAQGYLGMLRKLGYRLFVIGASEDPAHHDASDDAIMSLADRPGCDQLNLLAVPGT